MMSLEKVIQVSADLDKHMKSLGVFPSSTEKHDKAIGPIRCHEVNLLAAQLLDGRNLTELDKLLATTWSSLTVGQRKYAIMWTFKETFHLNFGEYFAIHKIIRFEFFADDHHSSILPELTGMQKTYLPDWLNLLKFINPEYLSDIRMETLTY